MKSLVVSFKSSSEVLEDFKRAFRQVKRRELKAPHFEISFDNRKDFEKFVKNIHLLCIINKRRPKSVYQLAKLTKMDVSNLNKVIVFLEEMGALRLKESTINGRTVKTPIVDYKRIEFNLAA